MIVIVFLFSAISLAMAAAQTDSFPSDKTLYQIVYNSNDSGTEVVTKLGTFSDFTSFFAQENVMLADAGSLSLNFFPESPAWGDLVVEYCALQSDSIGQNYPSTCIFAKTDASAFGEISLISVASFVSSFRNSVLQYNTGANVIINNSITRSMDKTGSYSFNSTMSNVYTPGQYAGVNFEEKEKGYARLSSFEDTASYVDMYLFCVDAEKRDNISLVDLSGTKITGKGEKEYIAVIRLYADGRTVLNPPKDSIKLQDIVSPAPIENGGGVTLTVHIDTGNSVDVDETAWEIKFDADVTGIQIDQDNTDSERCTIIGENVKVNMASYEESKDIVVTVTANPADATAGIASSKTFTLTIKNPDYVKIQKPVLKPIKDQEVTKADSLFVYFAETSNATKVDKWTLKAGPEGMTIGETTGRIYWDNLKTRATGTFTVKVKAENTAGNAEISFKLTLKDDSTEGKTPVIKVIDPQQIPTGKSFTLEPELSSGAADKWQIVTGAPSGMKMDESTGKLTWSQSVKGTYTITIKAANTKEGGEDTEQFILTVTDVTSQAPVIKSISGKQIVTGKSFTFQPELSSGKADKWQIETGAPSGMKMDASTGKLTWTNAVEGTYNITIKATNTGEAKDDTKAFTLTVSAATPDQEAPVIKSISNRQITAGESFTLQPGLSSGKADKWEIPSADMPAGLGIDVSTGKLTWLNPVEGQYTIEIKATDTSASLEDTEEFILTVSPDDTINQKPSKPAILSPRGNMVITTPQPTLIVKKSTDPDGDSIAYIFEIYDDEALTNKRAVTDAPTADTWWEVNISLKDDTVYYWRAQAIDGRGEKSDWSETGSFILDLSSYFPGPVVYAPRSGITIHSFVPVLSVYNREYSETAVNYEFELYKDAAMKTQTVLKTALVSPTPPTESASGDFVVSWEIPEDVLKDKSAYYWRVRANFATASSNWMDTAVFRVDTDKDETEISLIPANYQSYTPGMPAVIKVADEGSSFFGLSVEIPANAISDDYSVQAHEVLNGPGFPDNVKSRGAIVDFSPSGISFNEPVTIKLPYTDQDLDDCGVAYPEDLDILTYDPITDTWEKISADISVDIYESVLIAEIGHFSMYMVGKLDESGANTEFTEESADCFIKTLFYKN